MGIDKNYLPLIRTMLGKRSRSLRRIASVLSNKGLDCCPIDSFSAAEQCIGKRSSAKYGAPFTPLVVIGVNPTLCVKKQDEEIINSLASEKRNDPPKVIEQSFTFNLPQSFLQDKLLQHYNSDQPSHREPVQALITNNTQASVDGDGDGDGDGGGGGCGDGGRRFFSILASSSAGSYKVRAECVSLITMDFMEACFLCKSHLEQGRDIFMYKGDQAFCSEDCRYQQMVIDERAESQEKCSWQALKSITAVQSSCSTITAVQSSCSNHKTKILSATTAAAA